MFILSILEFLCDQVATSYPIHLPRCLCEKGKDRLGLRVAFSRVNPFSDESHHQHALSVLFLPSMLASKIS